MENIENAQVVKQAIEALNDVHGDTSVPLEDTFDRLRYIQGELGILLSAVEEDLANG